MGCCESKAGPPPAQRVEPWPWRMCVVDDDGLVTYVPPPCHTFEDLLDALVRNRCIDDAPWVVRVARAGDAVDSRVSTVGDIDPYTFDMITLETTDQVYSARVLWE